MKMISRTAFAAVFLLTACGGGSSHMNFPTSEPKSPNGIYQVSAANMPAVETDALRGSGDDAVKLYMHFEYFEMNHRVAMYWLQVAAENGDKSAARHLGEIMQADNDDPKHYLRAPFWLQKAR